MSTNPGPKVNDTERDPLDMEPLNLSETTAVINALSREERRLVNRINRIKAGGDRSWSGDAAALASVRTAFGKVHLRHRALLLRAVHGTDFGRRMATAMAEEDR